MRFALSCSLCRGIFFCFILGVRLTGLTALQITRLSVPPCIQSGSQESVILDCEYNLTEKDKSMVVKWFLNNDPEPIYQWIPELNSRHFSYRLEGKVNVKYTVSPSDDYTKYRAIKILRPTIDLSGIYTCTVGSLSGSDSKEKQMIVYSPPTVFTLNTTCVSTEKERLSCQAEGVFPLPHLAMYEVTSPARPRELTANSFDSEIQAITGAYNVEISRELTMEDLKGNEPKVFKCVLSIPGTKYQAERSVVYYPAAIDGHNVPVYVSVTLLTTCLLVLNFLL